MEGSKESAGEDCGVEELVDNDGTSGVVLDDDVVNVFVAVLMTFTSSWVPELNTSLNFRSSNRRH